MNNFNFLDFDEHKKLIGIEILSASKVMPQKVVAGRRLSGRQGLLSVKPFRPHRCTADTQRINTLLDYKPEAHKINAVNQLTIYALALASRTKPAVKDFKCAWFDDKHYYEFFPLQAVYKKTS